MGKIMTCGQVCSEINKKWGAELSPPESLLGKPATFQFLYEMIDKANDNVTNYGVTMGTDQLVDSVTCTLIVNQSWRKSPQCIPIEADKNIPSSNYEVIREMTLNFFRFL